MPFIILQVASGPGPANPKLAVRVNTRLIKSYFKVPEAPIEHQTVVQMLADDQDKGGAPMSLRCSESVSEIDSLIDQAEYNRASNVAQATKHSQI